MNKLMTTAGNTQPGQTLINVPDGDDGHWTIVTTQRGGQLSGAGALIPAGSMRIDLHDKVTRCDLSITVENDAPLQIERWEDRRTDFQHECLRRGDGKCQGEVSGRASYGGTGTMIYECVFHMDESAEKNQALRERYPEHQPADFDPTYAGESWYEDE
jgi:hypothetical protein